MPLRKAVFWLHLAAGLVVGTVVLMMSVTGVLLTYQKQMTEWADREFWTPPAREGVHVDASIAVAKAAAVADDANVRRLTYHAGPDGPIAATLDDGRVLYLDPSNGELRGAGSEGVRGFFSTVMRWHRWFNLTGDQRATGKAVTGWSNLVFFFLVLSGLYLWFPRRWTRQHFRPILILNRRARGKARDFNWHHVFGFWTAIPLALVVASATVISFPWASDLAYRAVGDEPPVRRASAPAPRPTPAPPVLGLSSAPATGSSIRPATAPAPFDPVALNPLVETARTRVADWRTITVTPPATAADPVSFRIYGGWGGESKKQATLTLDPITGGEVSFTTFEDQSRGRQFRTFLRFAHTGEFYGILGQTIAGLVTLASVLLVWSGFALAWRRLARPLIKRARA